MNTNRRRASSRLRIKEQSASRSNHQNHNPKTQRDSRFHKLISNTLKKYLNHIPTLLLSLPFYYGVYVILSTVHPSAIEDFILPNSFLPLLVVFFFGNFFFFSFLFLKTRRGFLFSLVLSILLFLKLQQVVFEIGWIAIFIAFFIFIELMSTVIQRLLTMKHKATDNEKD